MDGDRYEPAVRGVTLLWVWTIPVLFLVLVLLGLTMRLGQSGIINVDPDYFYAVMTVHGLGMAGVAFTGGLVAVNYLLRKYVRINLTIAWAMYGLTVLGVAGLVVACLIGRFGPGWYMLYPLPFLSNGVWPDWALGLAVLSLIVLGVAWLLGQIDLFRALLARYGLADALGWQYLGKERSGRTEIPPIVLISAAGCLVPGILTTIVGAVLLMLYLFKWVSASLVFDALLLKNMVFLWGHTLVNITMYLGLAVVYELLPEYTGRPWKTNSVVAVAWNLVLVLVLFAFFHHLYMDFAQPQWLQVAGQLSSYLISVPAAVVTIFSTLVLVYGSTMRWKLPSVMLYLGVMGWAIGGVAAVIDSTVMVNSRFHNTLWVPAHFHTYYVMGVVLMILGVVFHLSTELSKVAESDRLTRAIVGTVAVGGYGFLLMFYLAGVAGVPRRYAVYPAETAQGVFYAKLSLAFIAVLLLGALIYIWETGRRCVRALGM